MQVIFYNSFEKRHNSTKRPADNDNNTQIFEGALKASTDITNPTIQFQIYDNTVGSDFPSYCYVPIFGRYYHVNKWRYTQGLWECEMICDVLASFKNDILNSSAFVLYSSSQYNSMLVDNRLSTGVQTHINTTNVNLFGDGVLNHVGSYCIAVASTDTTQGVAYYYVTSHVIGQLISLLCTESATELIQQLENLFAGANFNSIISCTWLPFNFSDNPTADIVIANYNTGLKGNTIPVSEAYQAILPINWPYTDFRRAENFVKMVLTLPFVGTITLPTSEFRESTQLDIRFQLDGKTGTGSYKNNGNNGGQYFCSCTVGATIPISGMNVDPAGAIMTAASGVGSFASLSIGSGISQTFEAIQQAFAPTTSITGAVKSNANAMLYALSQPKPELNIYYTDWSDNPADVAGNIGRPLKAVTNLSSLSGYCQCANYSANCGLESETNEINRLMNGGVYIE